MKAVVFYGIGDVRIEEVRDLIPQDREIVIEVKACAICGTDLRIIKNGHKTVKPPAILGHEIVGVIKEIGKNINTPLKKGDSVVVVTPVGCGKCRFCNRGYQNMCEWVSKSTHSIGYYCDGGFAQYMRIPSEAVRNGNLIPFDYDGSVSYEELSLVEPLSCVLNGQEFLHIQKGESVLIFGCGAIGCMHAYLARYWGAEFIIMVDINPSRIAMVKKLNIAEEILLWESAKTLKERIFFLTENKGVDNAIVACSSKEAQKLAFEVTGVRGRISLFSGLPYQKRILSIDANDIHYLEKSVFGAFASAHHHYQKALELILKRKVSLENLISEVLPLEDFKRGIEILNKGEGFKVIMKP